MKRVVFTDSFIARKACKFFFRFFFSTLLPIDIDPPVRLEGAKNNSTERGLIFQLILR